MAFWKKKAAEAPKTTETENFWNGFGSIGPDADDAGGQDDKKPSESGQDALLKSIQALNEQIGDLNRGFQGPQGRRAPEASEVKVPKLDLSGLPDPLVDQKAYETALAERVNTGIAQIYDAREAQRRAQTAQQDFQQERVESLWDAFQSEYEDLAEDRDKVEVAASLVVKRAQKRGVDVERYVYGRQDKFMKDVAEEMKKLFPSGQAAAESDSDDDADRTDGIFGGSGAPVPKAKAKPEADGGLVADLHAIQRKTGFF